MKTNHQREIYSSPIWFEFPLMIKCTISCCGCFASSFHHCLLGGHQLIWWYQMLESYQLLVYDLLSIDIDFITLLSFWGVLLAFLDQSLDFFNLVPLISLRSPSSFSLTSHVVGYPILGGIPLRAKMASLKRTFHDTNWKFLIWLIFYIYGLNLKFDLWLLV